MPGDTCCVCGNTRAKDPHVSFHRFPSDQGRRQVWLRVFKLTNNELKEYSRVCSRHFPGANSKEDPQVNLGKRFASPVKRDVPWTKRAKRRDEVSRQLFSPQLLADSPSSSRSSMQTPAAPINSPSPQPKQGRLLIASVGEPLCSDYQVYELPCSASGCNDTEVGVSECTPMPESSNSGDLSLTVNAGLMAHIELLKAENDRLKKQLKESERQHFRVSQIRDNNKLFRFFTGFASYMHFLALFEFLGPAVNKLNYWGSRESSRRRHRPCKLDPENQMFLTIVKLRLDLKFRDLAFRFGISQAVASRYFTTWVCFLFHHLKEIDWVPSVQQITGTLPHSFKDKYPSTYAIIDGTEIFIETPSDLQMQSSTWSQYKHHNTAKFLVACSPNGGITYVSPLYIGSIFDIELTHISGFLTTLQDKPGISIMADRGFAIKDMLNELGVELNIPPFMEGRKQVPAQEVQPALVPPLQNVDSDVDEYFDALSSCTSSSDSEGEDSSAVED